MEWSIGIFVLVRCFSDKHKFDKEIVQKLGSSFTRTPFVVVVVSSHWNLLVLVMVSSPHANPFLETTAVATVTRGVFTVWLDD